MYKKICLVIIFSLASFFTQDSRAQDISSSYCIEPINFKTETPDLVKIKTFEKSPYPVFYVRKEAQPPSSRMGAPAILKDNEVTSVASEFPSNAAADEYVELPSGEVLGHAVTHFKPTPIYKQNFQTGVFEKFNIKGEDKLYHIQEMVWSENLGGVLMATQGKETSKSNPDSAAVYLLKSDAVEKVEGINEWVTSIVEIPEFKLTILGTEEKDRLYAIDSQKKVHFIDELNLGKRMFFSKILPLHNPDRVFILIQQALGPRQEYFVINLKTEDGVIVPSNISKATDGDMAEYENRKDTSTPRMTGYRILKSPLPDKWIAISKDGVYELDKEGHLNLIDNQKIVTKYYSQNNTFLPALNEVFIDGKNGYFVIKPREKCK